MSYVTSQPSLRDFGYLLRNPTLERVGYSRISLREIGVGYSQISPPGDVSRKWLIGDNRTRPENVQTLQTLYTPRERVLLSGHGNEFTQNNGEPTA